MKKWPSYLFLILLGSFISVFGNSQHLFHQDIFHGGVTSGGISYGMSNGRYPPV